MSIEKNKRYHGLDFARSVFMLLGVFYHTGLIFINDGGWRVESTETHQIFNAFAFAIRSFRMEAFYLIAGFFFMMLLNKKQHILKERIIKLLIPLFVIGFSLNYLMNEYSSNRDVTFSINYILKGEWLGHLWFIGNLILYYLLSFKLKNKIKEIKLNFYLQILLISLIFSVIKYYTVDVEVIILFCFVSEFFQYLPFYLFGMYIFKQKDVFFEFATSKNLIICFSLGFLLLIVSYLYKNENTIFVTMMSAVSSAFLALSSIIFLNIVGDSDRKLIRWLSESSYTVYLLHMPLIVIFSFYYLQYMDGIISPYVNFLIISLFVLLTTLTLYFFVIKKSKTLSLLIDGKSI